MSDDLVQRLRDHIAVVIDNRGHVFEAETLCDEAADRIEELEAKLAKAVKALELADRAIMERVSDLDMIKIASVFNHMRTIRTTLAELKGGTDG